MTIKELQAALASLIKRDEYLADATVSFGDSMEPIEGGIIAKNTTTNLVVLNLAPVKLDQIGGF